MTAQDLRRRLDRLVIARNHAEHTGLRENDFHMEALEREIAAVHAAYVGFSVTEIACRRARAFGRQRG
jgi:hypothetical protein